VKTIRERLDDTVPDDDRALHVDLVIQKMVQVCQNDFFFSASYGWAMPTGVDPGRWSRIIRTAFSRCCFLLLLRGLLEHHDKVGGGRG
jgi:hypothetical protein